MSAALSVDTDALEHAAADYREAAALLAPLARAPLAAGLYHRLVGGPPKVAEVLSVLQRRAEEAHAVANRLSDLGEQTADRLIDSARRFDEAEELCTTGGR